jgi:hypothetical protein
MNKENELKIVDKIIEECGYEVREHKDIEKVLSLFSDDEPNIELDVKIKKYAAKVNPPKKYLLLFKWSIPAIAVLLIVAVMIFFNLKTPTVNTSNKLNIQPRVSIENIDNIDVELALLDIEIGIAEYEIKKDNQQSNYEINSDNTIDTTYRNTDKKLISNLYTI